MTAGAHLHAQCQIVVYVSDMLTCGSFTPPLQARQLCLHHWDEPQLAALLAEPVAEQQRLQQQQAEQQQATLPAAARTAGSSYGAGSSAAAAGAAHTGSSSGAGAAAHGTPLQWRRELASLLGLRLLALEAAGQPQAYLQLAMAGGAWRKAIDCMLHSKER